MLSLMLMAVFSAQGKEPRETFTPLTPPLNLSKRNLTLTIEECTAMVLTSNFDVATRRLDTDIAEADILQARGTFDLNLTASGQRSESDGSSTNSTDTYQVGLEKTFFTGTKASVSTSETGSDDQDDQTLRAEISQPILRDAGIRVTRANVILASTDKEISLIDLEDEMMAAVSSVQNTYWDLILQRQRLDVQNDSLAFARQLETLNVNRAEAGLLASSDITEAQAATSSREADVFRAEENVYATEDTLKDQLALFSNPDNWAAHITPTSKPAEPKTTPAFLTALNLALRFRPDYRAELLRLDKDELEYLVARNRRLPKLDFVARAEQADASDVTSPDDEEWSVLLQFEFPLFNRSGRAATDRAKAERAQRILSLRQMENRIVREIRRALDALETNAKVVDASRKAVKLEEQKLANEQEKFNLGQSTTDNVVRFIQSLNNARLRLAQAGIDYNKSLVRLEQVQGTTLQSQGILLTHENYRE